MKLFKAFIFLFLVFCVAMAKDEGSKGVFTDAMEKTVVKIGNICMKSVGATLEEVNVLMGEPPYHGKAVCVLSCIFNKLGIMEKNQFSKQGFIRSCLPFILADSKKIKSITEIATICENETKNIKVPECEEANYVVTCLRKNMPTISNIKF